MSNHFELDTLVRQMQGKLQAIDAEAASWKAQNE
jgi:hypothetical protein